MSKQRDDAKAKLKRLEDSWDGFCPTCGHELYMGDPPVRAICENPNCPDCDPDVLQGPEVLLGEDYDNYYNED